MLRLRPSTRRFIPRSGLPSDLIRAGAQHKIMFLIRSPLSSLPERRQSLNQMVTASTATLLFITGALIVMLALLILFNENYNATKGYKLRTLERERSQLLLTEEILKMHISEAQSLNTFLTDPKINSMIQVKNPQYSQEDKAVASAE
jgi:hypothetical protein